MKILPLIMAVTLCACLPKTPFEHDVSVSIDDFTEFGDEYSRIGRIVIGVKNHMEVPVYTTSISIQLKTDGHAYYTTVYDDRGVPPGMKIFLVVEMVYISPEESATLSGVTITDVNFM